MSVKYYKKRPKNWLHAIWLKVFDSSYYRILQSGYAAGFPGQVYVLCRLSDHETITLPIPEFEINFYEVINP